MGAYRRLYLFFRLTIARLICILPFVLSGSGALATNRPVRVTSVAGVDEYRLNNGLRALVHPNGESGRITVGMSTLAQKLDPYGAGNPRNRPTWDEMLTQLQAADVDDLRPFHQSYYGAASALICAVGPVDPDELTQLLRENLGDWRSQRSYEPSGAPDRPPEATRTIIEVQGQGESALAAGVWFPLRQDDADYPALLVANELLGGGPLNSRLAARLQVGNGSGSPNFGGRTRRPAFGALRRHVSPEN